MNWVCGHVVPKPHPALGSQTYRDIRYWKWSGGVSLPLFSVQSGRWLNHLWLE